ncbi:flagellar hook-basal body protein [Anaerobacillus sp. MEB173]|uniref:flagellar hook-basal body protein n=1 Tax=Anaerobacillus sp. MEB173 TaxID=3383345 RepID=UPI003F92C276
MLRGLYTSAAGMISQQRRQEMLTNNLANANTPGFKADQTTLRSFPNMLINEMSNAKKLPGSNPIGSLSTGVYMQEAIPKFLQGDMQETGNRTDIALLQGLVPINDEGQQGMLLYAIQAENGETRYTRNGNFTIDGQGMLVTNDGHYVLGQNGQRIAVGSEDFSVNELGLITTAQGVAGQLNVVFAEDPTNLVKEGSGLFRLEGGQALPTAIGNPNITYQLKQGFIERSNVDLNDTMTDMMTAFRAFEANQKVLQAYDRSLEKAVNEVGRIG